MQFAQAHNGLLAGADLELDTTSTENDMEMKREVEQRMLHWMAKAHDFLEMWQGSQNLWPTQKDSRTQIKLMRAIGYTADTEEIVKASWSNFKHDGAAAFKLSERLPVPAALPAKDLPGGRSQILNICRMERINHHPAKSDQERSPERISDC